MVLESADGQRLPIWVGPFEATALALTLEAVETPRPLTYQMAAGLLAAAGARAAETRITRLDNGGTFYAVVIVDGPGRAARGRRPAQRRGDPRDHGERADPGRLPAVRRGRRDRMPGPRVAVLP